MATVVKATHSALPADDVIDLTVFHDESADELDDDSQAPPHINGAALDNTNNRSSQRVRRPSRKLVENGVVPPVTPPRKTSVPLAKSPSVASSAGKTTTATAAVPSASASVTAKRALAALPVSSSASSSSSTSSSPSRPRREARKSRKALEVLETEQPSVTSDNATKTSSGGGPVAKQAVSPAAFFANANGTQVRTRARTSSNSKTTVNGNITPEKMDAIQKHLDYIDSLAGLDTEQPAKDLGKARASPPAPAPTLADAAAANITEPSGSMPHKRRRSSRLSQNVARYDMDWSDDESHHSHKAIDSDAAVVDNTTRPFVRTQSTGSDLSSALTDLPSEDELMDDDGDDGDGSTLASAASASAMAQPHSTVADTPATVTDSPAGARALRPRRSKIALRDLLVNESDTEKSSTSSPARARRVRPSSSALASTSFEPSSSSTAKEPATATETNTSAPIAEPTFSPRFRPATKTYLSAGLYSGDANVVSIDGVLRNGRLGADGKVIEPVKKALPLPIHFGKDLLEQKVEFALPYPIVEQSDKLRLLYDARRKPPPYRPIDKNRYVTRKKIRGEIPQCNCDPSSDCGDNCLNRLLGFICDPEVCPCGVRCTNGNLKDRPHAECDVAWYGQRGFGLRSLENIDENHLVDEYRGEIINLKEAARRVNEIYKDTGNFYFLEYDAAAGEVLDGGLRGNVTRFANHSCNPNCYIDKFIICGTDEQGSAEFQIGLFANRDIKAGEELTYDYGWSQFNPKRVDADPVVREPDSCYCGAPGCSGILGAKRMTQPRAPTGTAKGAATLLAARGTASSSTSSSSASVAGASTPDTSLRNKSILGKRSTGGRNVPSPAAAQPVSKKARTANSKSVSNTSAAAAAAAAALSPASEARAKLLLKQATQMIKGAPNARSLTIKIRKGAATSQNPPSALDTLTTATETSSTTPARSSARTRKSSKQEPVVLTASSSTPVAVTPPPSAPTEVTASLKRKKQQDKAERRERKKLRRERRRAKKAVREATKPLLPVIKELSQSEALLLMQRNMAARGLTGAGFALPSAPAGEESSEASGSQVTLDATPATAADQAGAGIAAVGDQTWVTVNDDSDSDSDEDSSESESDSDSEDGDDDDDELNSQVARESEISDTSMSTSVSASPETKAAVETLTAAEAPALQRINRGAISLADYPPNTRFRYSDGQECPRSMVEEVSKRKSVYSEDEHKAKRRLEYQRRQEAMGRTVSAARAAPKGEADEAVSLIMKNKGPPRLGRGANGRSSRASVPAQPVATIPAKAKKVSANDDAPSGSGATANGTSAAEASHPGRRLMSTTAQWRERVRSAFAPRSLVASSLSPPLTDTTGTPAATRPSATGPPPPGPSSSSSAASPGNAPPTKITTQVSKEVKPPARPVKRTPARASKTKSAVASASAKGKGKARAVTLNGTPRALNHRPSVVSRGQSSDGGRQQYQSTRDLPHNIITADGYFIPGLPTELMDLGIFQEMRDARKARNAFLVRIRRNLISGMSSVDATDEAAYRLPQSGTPLDLARSTMARKLGFTLPTVNVYYLKSKSQRTTTDPRIAEALAQSVLPNARRAMGGNSRKPKAVREREEAEMRAAEAQEASGVASGSGTSSAWASASGSGSGSAAAPAGDEDEMMAADEEEFHEDEDDEMSDA
ncbi:unnamed protein product [Sympodiomycopsis kandeliae]